MNFNNQKRNFERYLGTRKYKLSFWGFDPHVDWIILISYILIGFVFVVFGAVIEFNDVSKNLDQEVVSEIKKETFDYKKVNSLVESYFEMEKVNNSEIEISTSSEAEVDQTQ